MSRATHLAFLSVAVFLVFFTGTVGKPGLPPTLKADEPAYLAMAMSLVADGDLRCNAEDFPRLIDSYPYLPVENLILMSDDGWQTIYFGKPYLYPLFAAPFVAAFGTNGLVAFNALLFVFMIWCGTRYLKLWNSEALALLFSAAFFFLSPVWAYVFWMQPEVFNLACLTAAFLLVFAQIGTAKWAVPVSAAALALGVYNKPVLLAFALPLLYAVWRNHNRRQVMRWLAALALGGLVLAGGSMFLTGHPSAYLGVARAGIKVETPEAVQKVIAGIPQRLAEASKYANSWAWVFRRPPTTFTEVRQSLGYFFWGRHTGLLLYMPFAVVCFVLFLIHRRHRPEGWLSLLAMAVIALFFICVIPLNWHGGGGFIGNRYFLMAYPAFLFLVTKVRPAWLTVPGAAAAGLFLGSILFTPFGAFVPLPTLQSHTRNPPFQLFPIELSLRKALPGYEVFGYSHVALMGRQDVFIPHEKIYPWVQGRVPVDILVLTDRPIQGLFFEVSTFPADNEIVFEFAGDRKVVEFENAVRRKARKRVIELQPQKKPREHHELGALYYVYDMRIRTSAGERIFDKNMPSDVFFAGAQLNFIGRRDQIARPEHYRVEWLGAEAPFEVDPKEIFSVQARLRNASESPFDPSGPIPVNIGYRWVSPDGSNLGRSGKRTRLAEPLEPGAELATSIEVKAPAAAGEFRLELDLVRENVGWFSDVSSKPHTIAVRVRQPDAIE